MATGEYQTIGGGGLESLTSYLQCGHQHRKEVAGEHAGSDGTSEGLGWARPSEVGPLLYLRNPFKLASKMDARFKSAMVSAKTVSGLENG